ncbi:MAG: hypothetical protein R2880_13645 [Deinococcales bacterium]
MKRTPEYSNKLLDSLLGWFLVLMLIIGLGLALWAVKDYKPNQQDLWQKVLRGGWTSDFDKELNDKIAFRQLAIDSWGALEYGLFGTGRKGVLVGQDGWLFSDEEFQYYPDEALELANKVGYIQEVKDTLAEVGARLVVLVLPAKIQALS